MQAPSLYKHFSGKADVESVLIGDALFAIGDATHAVLHGTGSETPLRRLLDVYHSYGLSHPNLYRLATSGHLDRERLPDGLEEWAGNPWFVVTGDPWLAQALWSFAHGMLDTRTRPSLSAGFGPEYDVASRGNRVRARCPLTARCEKWVLGSHGSWR